MTRKLRRLKGDNRALGEARDDVTSYLGETYQTSGLVANGVNDDQRPKACPVLANAAVMMLRAAASEDGGSRPSDIPVRSVPRTIDKDEDANVDHTLARLMKLLEHALA